MAEKAKTAGNKKWAYIAIGIVLLIVALFVLDTFAGALVVDYSLTVMNDNYGYAPAGQIVTVLKYYNTFEVFSNVGGDKSFEDVYEEVSGKLDWDTRYAKAYKEKYGKEKALYNSRASFVKTAYVLANVDEAPSFGLTMEKLFEGKNTPSITTVIGAVLTIVSSAYFGVRFIIKGAKTGKPAAAAE